MFCSVLILIFAVASSSVAQLQEYPSSPTTQEPGSGGGIVSEIPFLCSETGNCTCLRESNDSVKATCTSVGDEFDKIAQELPEMTTHL